MAYDHLKLFEDARKLKDLKMCSTKTFKDHRKSDELEISVLESSPFPIGNNSNCFKIASGIASALTL